MAVVNRPPDTAEATAIATTLGAAAFDAPGVLPQCPGPFGGTTVIVLPPDVSSAQIAAWKAIEENDPLAKASRFYRVRIATEGGKESARCAGETAVGATKNILIVPGVFFASPDWMRTLWAVSETSRTR